MQLLRNPLFWMLVVSSSMIVGGAITKSAHLAPLMVERGFSLDRAAIILSIAGGMGVLGSPCFGWLAERWGGGVTLAITAFLQGGAWILLLVADSFALLVADAVIVGACGGAYMVSTAVLISSLFGPRQFSRVFGLLSPITIPVIFGAAPAAGWLRDVSGSYTTAFLLHIVGFGIAGFAGLWLARRERHGPRAKPLPA